MTDLISSIFSLIVTGVIGCIAVFWFLTVAAVVLSFELILFMLN